MQRYGVTMLVIALTGCSSESVDVTVHAPGLRSTPLAERSAAAGTRFHRLDPAASGFVFTNELRKENVIPYIYSGAGVAVGDYDADGWPDVYMVSQDGPNRLFRQTAPLRFEDVTESAGGLDGGEAWGTAAAFADIDGDGDLDLYVCNTEAPNLLYRNNGDGTFNEVGGKLGLALTRSSTGVAFADYDNDGDLDLYLLTNRVFGPRLPEAIVREVTLPADTRTTVDEMFPPYPEFGPLVEGERTVPAGYEEHFMTLQGRVFPTGQQDVLLRNDGYAKWTDVTEAAGVAHFGQGLSATWWDYDDDGDLDLYVANDLESPDKLFENRGDGTFADATKRALPHIAFFGMGADFADIDGDGRFDFCVADMSSTTHYMSKLLMGDMGFRRWFLMNSDPPQVMRNAVFLNTGTARFEEAAQLTGLASSDWTWTVRFADLDEDGREDFFATNGMASFDNDPDAGSRFTKLWRSGSRDEALDVIRGLERVAERNIARRNLGDLQFEDVGSEWGLDASGVSNGAVVTDLDRDGDLDVVVNNTNEPAAVFENRTHGTHRVTISLEGSASNRHGIGAHVTVHAGGRRQVRLVVLARGYMSSGDAVAHFGLGGSERIERLDVRWPSGHTQSFTDLVADRHYTVTEPTGAAPDDAGRTNEPVATWLTTETFDAERHAEREFDDYAIQPLLPHRLSREGPGIAVGDVNGDGRDDVWIGGASGQPGQLMITTADGSRKTRSGPWRDDAACEDLGAVLFDADGDGDLDLFVASGSIEHEPGSARLADRLYLNTGDGTFTRAPTDALPDDRGNHGHVAAADYDRDGDLDLFVGGRAIRGAFPEATPSKIYRNDGAGRFATVEGDALATIGLATSAVWSDYDDDGWVDLLVTAQWQPIRVFHNDEGTLRDVTDDVGLATMRGLWNSIAPADLDGDGDLDYVVTNLGLNTKYHADPSHPIRIYAKDFDGNGVRDVVESKYEGDRLLPVRGRSCSTDAMPFVGQQFETFREFASATLPEIYGADELESSLELSADELRHVVLENDGGRFTPRPLPRRAQIAPGFGIGVLDVDGDYRLDIVLAQNSYSPEPETGRFDGGLGAVLRGRGDLTFEPVIAQRSGLVLPCDAKALAVVDPSGGFVVSANDDSPRHVRRSGPATTRAVRLRGPRGNPTAIGARIRARRGDERLGATEIHAGAGYLSQSSPIVFVDPRADAVEVRWPDGTTSSHPIDAKASDVVTIER